jgi:DNA-binding MarR family transcriptional regulator
VIGGLAAGAGGVPLSQLVKELGISRPAAGQLIDTLVLHGYLDRATDAGEHGSARVTLTAQGHAAAAAQAAAREGVDIELANRVGADCVAHMRRALGVLCTLGGREPDEAPDH